jgi:hypothetical protein
MSMASSYGVAICTIDTCRIDQDAMPGENTDDSDMNDENEDQNENGCRAPLGL